MWRRGKRRQGWACRADGDAGIACVATRLWADHGHSDVVAKDWTPDEIGTRQLGERPDRLNVHAADLEVRGIRRLARAGESRKEAHPSGAAVGIRPPPVLLPRDAASSDKGREARSTIGAPHLPSHA